VPALDVQQAAHALAAGGLVAFATETVYGLGARADDEQAVARIFQAKGRPPDHPLIVHLAAAADAAAFCADIPDPAARLMQAFWPGPLTLVLPRRPGMAAAAAGGQDTIGLRVPAHAMALQLLAACRALGVPGVAAPSANRFGRISPTTAAHVRAEFGPALAVLDGGACAVGIESTIIDLSRGPAVLLRPGQLSRLQIEAVLGHPLQAADASAPRASGTLEAHYAPQAVLRLLPRGELAGALRQLPRQAPGALAVYSRSAPLGLPATPDGVLWRQMPDDAAAAAHELFAALRELDAAGVRQIWVEAPPDGPQWEGVSDRLTRAAAAGRMVE
jgi:L-threonylcarbamoyladenylate synthase